MKNLLLAIALLLFHQLVYSQQYNFINRTTLRVAPGQTCVLSLTRDWEYADEIFVKAGHSHDFDLSGLRKRDLKNYSITETYTRKAFNYDSSRWVDAPPPTLTEGNMLLEFLTCIGFPEVCKGVLLGNLISAKQKLNNLQFIDPETHQMLSSTLIELGDLYLQLNSTKDDSWLNDLIFIEKIKKIGSIADYLVRLKRHQEWIEEALKNGRKRISRTPYKTTPLSNIVAFYPNVMMTLSGHYDVASTMRVKEKYDSLERYIDKEFMPIGGRLTIGWRKSYKPSHWFALANYNRSALIWRQSPDTIFLPQTGFRYESYSAGLGYKFGIGGRKVGAAFTVAGGAGATVRSAFGYIQDTLSRKPMSPVAKNEKQKIFFTGFIEVGFQLEFFTIFNVFSRVHVNTLNHISASNVQIGAGLNLPLAQKLRLK